MAIYRITYEVKKAKGSQSWLVEADNEADALRKHNAGESDLENEDIEIYALGDPVITQEK